jgi:hypothetical protein
MIKAADGEMDMPEVRFHKGDRVKFKLATRWVRGVVKEDRGPIGIGGRRLYLVEFPADPESPSRVELPAAEMEPVRGTAAAK